jgi:predicted Zn-dependent peptidase
MDAVGGVLNAFTGKEYTCYYAKVLDENLELAIDLLTDIFLHSVFDREEIERERSVILQEISQVEDTPDDYVHELFSLDFFREHPLGLPICGAVSTVSHFQREDFLDFVRGRYLPHRVIVAASGHLNHAALVKELEARLGAVRNSGPRVEVSESTIEAPPKLQRGVFKHSKHLEQVHVCMGVGGIHQTHPQRYAAYILNTILGGGMSSRLFQEIREKRGRAYSIYSFLSSYRDVGYLGIYAGTSLDWLEEVVDLIVRELSRFTRGDIREAEIERAKSQIIGGTILGLESSDSWMSHIAKNEIYFGRMLSLDEISHGVRSVSREDVVEVAGAFFQPQGMALTLLGDFEKRDVDIVL